MSYYFSSLLTEKAKHSKTFLIIKSSTFKGLIRQENIVVIGQFCAYRIFQLNFPDIYSKIGSFDPAFFWPQCLIGVWLLLMKCNFVLFFSGWFIITDPWRPRGSLSRQMILPFVLPQELQGWQPYVHHPKLQYYGTIHFVVQHPSYFC